MLPAMVSFVTTRWSLVIAAGGQTADARDALQRLCTIYWSPLYLFVRHDARGRSAADAADLTQEFFAQLLARHDFAKVDASRGRFRTWLLQSMRHFLANQYDQRTALKRGGGDQPLSLDVAQVEQLYERDRIDGEDPERLYTRRWAMVAVGQAIERLRLELSADEGEKKARELDAIIPALLGDSPDGGYEGLAAALGTNATRLRQIAFKWRALLREEVAETLDLSGDVDAELDELLRALE